VLHPAGQMTSAELVSKGIFLKVSLRGVQELSYLGANAILKL